MILKRGDRIHICVPSFVAEDPGQVKTLTDFYNSYGIMVAMMSHTTATPSPVIVAVFRDL